MVELRHRQAIGLPPFAAAVAGIPHASVIPRKDGLRISRIDPDVVHIAMRSNESPNRGETFARVLAHNKRAVRLKNAVRIFWIDNQVREIERAPEHPITFVPFLPA